MTELVVNGVEFVIIPKKEYLRLRGKNDTVDAVEHGRASVSEGLRAARVKVGLTQAGLASLLKKSQAMVSAAEAGKKAIGSRYVRAVLKACHLPDDWKPGK